MGTREACLIDGCDTLRVGLGYCGKHYQRLRKYGDPLFVKPNPGNRSVRITPTVRTCRTCGHVGPRSEFRNARNTCKPCARKLLRIWNEQNPEKVAAQIARQKATGLTARWELRSRARKLGLDPNVVEAYYVAHDGRCEICGNPPRKGGRDLNMDHNHTTGAFRGMLCDNCNAGLGRFKDDPVRMEAAILYLKRTADAR